MMDAPLVTGSHTEADRTDVRSRHSDVDRLDHPDHEVDHVLPVVLGTDVGVTNAAGMIDDEANVRATC